MPGCQVVCLSVVIFLYLVILLQLVLDWCQGRAPEEGRAFIDMQNRVFSQYVSQKLLRVQEAKDEGMEAMRDSRRVSGDDMLKEATCE